jgi:hypothetical protein
MDMMNQLRRANADLASEIVRLQRDKA